MTHLTPQKPNAPGQATVNHGGHFQTAHLNVVFEGLVCFMVWQVICTMFKHPWGKGEWEHSFKDLQYVQLYIPHGWRVVKIQWEGMFWICACQVSPVKKWLEDIQAEIQNEEARTCKWGFHVCGLWLFFPLCHTCFFSSSINVSAQVLRGEMFLWTLWLRVHK